MIETTLAITPRNAARRMDVASLKRLPFTVEHTYTPDGTGYDFAWSGPSAYLALYDMVLTDGVVIGDEVGWKGKRDLRRRLTFMPRGVTLQGWAEPKARRNSFIALYFDQDWLLNELEAAPKQTLRPAVHFTNNALLHNMVKLGRLVRAIEPAPRIMTDSLALIAGAELMRSLTSKRAACGGLTSTQLNAVRDYLDAHMAEDLSVGDLAAAAGLSVFYFTRRFKTATGATPYRYVLEARVERAKTLMKDKTLPLSAIAQQAGFTSASHFSRAFADIIGLSPRDFRSRAG